MAFSRKTTVADADVLAQKKNRLNAYVAQFDKAVSLITDTIDNLGVINGNINSTIQEIDEYQLGRGQGAERQGHCQLSGAPEHLTQRREPIASVLCFKQKRVEKLLCSVVWQNVSAN